MTNATPPSAAAAKLAALTQPKEDMALAIEAVDRISSIVSSKTVLKDILIRENEPVRVQTPSGLETLPPDVFKPWDRQSLAAMFSILEPSWRELILDGAVDRPLNKDNVRYRVNMFTFDGAVDLTQNNNSGGKSGRLGVVIRVFPTKIPKLESIQVPPKVAGLVGNRFGLVLVVGGTSMGKSTTVASMLERINERDNGHIITIEDPIEYVHRNINCVVTQREVGTNAESIATAVRNAMREAPRAISVGEIRDDVTAQWAVRAGQSGSLTFGTLHANSTRGALNKMIGMLGDAGAAELADALLCVITQVLVPTADKMQYTPAYEVLYIDDEMRKTIADRQLLALQTDLEGGQLGSDCNSLNEALVRKIEKKEISYEVAVGLTYNRMDLAHRVKELRNAPSGQSAAKVPIVHGPGHVGQRL
jgi:twitching motility protein PilT